MDSFTYFAAMKTKRQRKSIYTYILYICKYISIQCIPFVEKLNKKYINK